jgi:hypothetical protein
MPLIEMNKCHLILNTYIGWKENVLVYKITEAIVMNHIISNYNQQVMMQKQCKIIHIIYLVV